MFIKNFQLFNYKSYIDSGLLEFSPGINIIIGQNNSGKTALLEALTLELSNKPHRSIRTLPSIFSKIEGESHAEIQLYLEKEELRTLLEQIPPPLGIPDFYEDYYVDEPDNVFTLFKIFSEWLTSSNPVEIRLLICSNSALRVKQIQTSYESKLFSHTEKYRFIQAQRKSDGTIHPDLIWNEVEHPDGGIVDSELVDCKTIEAGIEQTIFYKIFDLFKNRIYRFYAERLNIKTCHYGKNTELKPDASNLAEVLYLLPNKNPSQFRRFNQYVSTIFPNIAAVSVISHSDVVVEVKVWTVEAAEHNREDLTLLLSDCGTGVSQVLSMLYVVITSQFPRTIIIDEPQSFLHPGAAKKLIEILKEFPQHQYFIATHSPMLIAAANPSKIIKLTYKNNETAISVIDSQETSEQRSILAEVGVRLSDVFGADSILWVEGPTEEQCFPLILEKVAKKLLKGTVILAVQATGDLEGKRAEVIFDIYNKLSGGKSLFPPAIGFVLDCEGRPKTKKEELKKRSKNLITFLHRCMYENYLLEPEAVATVINKDDQSRESPLTSMQVENWINQKRQEGKYLKSPHNKQNLSDSEWLEKVDAANLLKDLFNDCSETRVAFSKTKHSYELTEWIVEHKQEHLIELAELLESILNDK